MPYAIATLSLLFYRYVTISTIKYITAYCQQRTGVNSTTLSCSPSVTVCSCVGLGLGLGLGNRVRVRNRV